MLPAEILDHIFSFLPNDPDTFNSCSAALPWLSSLVERHIFAHITIYLAHASPIDGFLVSQLSRCLYERPYLANHFRSITLDCPFLYPPDNVYEELSTILPLVLRSEKVSLRNIEWPRLPEKLRSALLDCLRMPHMKEIAIQNTIDFPLAILDNARNIKTLRLEKSRCSFRPCATLPTSAFLEYLFLDDVDYLQEFTYARATRLISLHAKSDLYFRFPNLSPILNACSESLRSLTLNIGTSFQTVYLRVRGLSPSVISPLVDIPADISILACLEVVTFHAMIFIHTSRLGDDTVRCDSSLPAITQLVRTATPSLKRVVLNLACGIEVAPDLRDVMEWQPVIHLIDSLAHLQVDLCIRASASHGQLSFVEVVDSLVGNQDLSRLVEQGSLIIKPLFPPDF